MGLESTFFVLGRHELGRVLRGWREPATRLDKPVQKQFLNPFTGQTETYWTRQNPDQPEAESGAVEAPELASSDATFVCKWVTEHELAQFMVAAGIVREFEEARDQCASERMNGPVDAYGMVHRVPWSLVHALKGANAQRLEEIATQLVHLFADEQHLRWTTSDAVMVLSGMQALAEKAGEPDTILFLHQGLP